MRKFVFLSALFFSLSSGVEVKAQGILKSIFSKKKSKTVETVMTPEEQEEYNRIQMNEALYVNTSSEDNCVEVENELLVTVPQTYKRENLNEIEQCNHQISLPSGQLINEEYMINEEYYQFWDSRSINLYDVSVKNFKDTVNLHLHDEDQDWSHPLDNEMHVTSKYGFRRWRFHHGVDLRLNIGDTVRSVFDGVVRIAKYNRRGYGYYVVIRHKNGLETLYGHMTNYIVKPGMEVKAGEPIGFGGNTGRSTGPHLHFEVRYQGNGFNPDDLFHFEDRPELMASNFELTPEHYSLLIESSKSVYHRIRSGDNLWKISRRYGTSITKICRLNGISRRTTLRIGRKIRVR